VARVVVEPRNVKLALAINGVNPFCEKINSWSSWPVLLFNYNLPPWLITKNFFVMLALIILGQESIKLHNIDIYVAPLIEELQVLWRGVIAWDMAKEDGQR